MKLNEVIKGEKRGNYIHCTGLIVVEKRYFSNPSDFDLFCNALYQLVKLKEKNQLKRMDKLLSIIIPIITTKTYFWVLNNIDYRGVLFSSFKNINIFNNIAAIEMSFRVIVNKIPLPTFYSGKLYHTSMVSGLKYLLPSYGGLGSGSMYTSPRVYATKYPCVRNGMSVMISDNANFLKSVEDDLRDSKGKPNSSLISDLYCIYLACECTVYEIESYTGELYTDTEISDSHKNSIMFINTYKPVRIQNLNTSNKLTYMYLKNNYPLIYQYLSDNVSRFKKDNTLKIRRNRIINREFSNVTPIKSKYKLILSHVDNLLNILKIKYKFKPIIKIDREPFYGRPNSMYIDVVFKNPMDDTNIDYMDDLCELLIKHKINDRSIDMYIEEPDSFKIIVDFR